MIQIEGTFLQKSIQHLKVKPSRQDAPQTPNGFWNLKPSLPATRHFHTDSHCAQCCLEFSWDGVLVNLC